MEKKEEFKLEEIKIEDFNPVISDAEYDQIELLNAYEVSQQELAKEKEKNKDLQNQLDFVECQRDFYSSENESLKKVIDLLYDRRY